MIKENLKFKYTWRSYQAKFLDGFHEHILDNHLHVIAPPGSGKTILGLEMLIRIGKPTLVLSPTLTIRNQWQERLQGFFSGDSPFDSHTLDIKKPNVITFSTYQSLFALYKSFDENPEKLIKFIKHHKIETLVLDEAHHLKNGWWNCLFLLKSIDNLTIISLTATPPYDSSAKEVNRYFELCGPIDDEIAVPDLIRNGDLCPHQDFIHFSTPNEADIKYIVEYRENILTFTNDLIADETFQSILLNLKIYAEAEASLELIYQNPSFFSAILIFLNSSGIYIEEEKLNILGFKEEDPKFPSFSYEWSEILLQHLLIDEREAFIAHEDVLLPIEKRLRRIGVLSKRKVNFVGDDSLYKNLANSPNKLKSIAAILEDSYSDLGERTRAVVLTDFIRKEFLNFEGNDVRELNQLGVVSIFQYILARTRLTEELAVLTGSLVILHKGMIADFKELLQLEVIRAEKLPHQEDYYSIRVKESAKNNIVNAITALFKVGKIKILIGTKSLLGEGWDAPSINTLVLASYVGSFVSSNQMRGRAIRVEAANPTKVGNIWHLACLDPTNPDGGKDMEKLKQRFQAFTGVSLDDEVYIENGLERLNLPKIWDYTEDITILNEKMLQTSQLRSELKDRWDKAIKDGNILTRELKVPYGKNQSFAAAKKLTALNAFKYLFFELGTVVSFFFFEFVLNNFGMILNKGWLAFLYFLFVAIFFGFAPKTYKALKVYFLFGDQYKKTIKIGKALLNFMKDKGKLASPEVQVHSDQKPNGTFFIYLEHASQHESSLFINLLAEVIAPIENPRYILVGGNWLKKKMGFRTYYTVPASFAKKKKDAEAFAQYWEEYVDGSELMYMYTLQGRKELLKARFAHIRYEFEQPVTKAIAWK